MKPNEQSNFALLHENMYDMACHYVFERGWSVIPIDLDSKMPLIKWKEFQTRLPTAAELSQWFQQGVQTVSGDTHTYFNIGLVTGAISGVVVVDGDNEGAIRYALDHGMTTPFSAMTARGRHYYWQHPGGGQRFGNKAGANPGPDWPPVDGLDFRGDGGFVVLPPSVRFKDAVATHQYAWDIAPGADWGCDLPVWQGTKPVLKDVTTATSFTFEDIDLSSVRIASPEDIMSVRDAADAKVKALGRKLTDGDATDSWMVRFAGSQVRLGLSGTDLVDLCKNFYDEFFTGNYSTAETDVWVRGKCRSAEAMDRRNHPEDYDSEGNRKSAVRKMVEPVAEVEEIGVGPKRRVLKPIIYDDLDDIEAGLGEAKYFLDPWVRPGTITQIVGFNGHGKSYWLLGAMFAAANGKDFGPYTSDGPVRTMYFDFDGIAAREYITRMRDFKSMYGNPHSLFQYWSSQTIAPEDGGDMNPWTESGANLLRQWINQAEPGVVVIDTIRSAFSGMVENRAEDWAHVNRLVKEIRNSGCAVVLVHHRNKPGEAGLGREAGSTAQLTDIDTQVFITKVYEEELDAQRNAGLFGGKLEVRDKKNVYTPHGYFRGLVETSTDRVDLVLQAAYGKTRGWTVNYETHYVAWVRRQDGTLYTLATMSMRQKASFLIKHGYDQQKVAARLSIPIYQIDEWVQKEARS